MRNQHGIKIAEKNIRREKESKISAFEQEVEDLKILDILSSCIL